MDTPPHRLIYASVALTRRVTRVSTITLFFFNYWKPWMAKNGTITKIKVQELTYKLVSKANNLNNNFCPIR